MEIIFETPSDIFKGMRVIIMVQSNIARLSKFLLNNQTKYISMLGPFSMCHFSTSNVLHTILPSKCVISILV